MLKVVIIDNTLRNKTLYEKIFNLDRDVELVDVVDNFNDLKVVLSTKKVELLAINSNLIPNDEMIRFKEISKEFSLNLMILNSRITFNEEEKVKEQLQKVKEYFYGECSIINEDNIVAIASSTGGPKALQEIIPKLPSSLNAIVLIVQHMPASFTAGFAERLNSISAISVKEAVNGEKLINGTAYIAPGDYHMLIKEKNGDLFVELTKGEKYKGVRPAADILMESVSEINKYKKMGIVLTGMGSDGAVGIESLKKAGAHNIAQDEKTSTIFGMPKAAIDTGCIDEVLPLENIWRNIILKVGCKNGYRY